MSSEALFLARETMPPLEDGWEGDEHGNCVSDGYGNQKLKPGFELARER